MKNQMKMCFFISMKFILIQIKFEIHISNDELLEIIWKHNKWGEKKVDHCHLVLQSSAKPNKY
jgi:hypothetical protein